MLNNETIKISGFITTEEDDFLKTLNQNRSVAIRMLIDEKMNQHGKLLVDRGLMYLLFIVIIGILLLLILQILFP